MTSDLYRSIPILGKTRNLSSHTTCSLTPAACSSTTATRSSSHATVMFW